MGGRGRYVCCLAIGLALVPCEARAREWTPFAALTTDYVLRGVSQTDGGPALQAGLRYQDERGWYAGAWASNVDTGRGYYADEGAHTELDLFVGYARPLAGDWSLDVQLLHYVYPDDGAYLDYDYTELAVALACRDWLRVSVAVSGDTSMLTYRGPVRERTAVAWDLAVQRPLVAGLSLVAGLGYYDLSNLYGTGYAYGNLGLSADVGRTRVELGHYRTNDIGVDLFGSRLAGGRTVLSIIMSLP